MSALSVLYLVLPFPLAFIIHDAEEVAVQHKWMLAHKESLATRFPKMKSMIGRLAKMGTKAFALAAFEELVVLLLATACVLIDAPYATEFWSALFLAFSFHLMIHIGQGIILRGYVPGLVTSILLLPYSFLGLQTIWSTYSLIEIFIYVILGIAIMVINLIFAHWIGLKLCKQ